MVLDPAATYRITGNSFLVSGTGDNFTVFALATDRVIGPVDSIAFVDYIGAFSPVPVPPLDRVQLAP